MAVKTSSTFIENQAMYVLGGFSFTNEDLGQMFWIDLSTSWNTSSPAYRRLPDGYPDAGFATVLLGDQKTWFVLSKQKAYLYNLQTSIWVLLEQSSLFSKGGGLKAAVNPTTGRIYVPGGYSSFLSGTKMLIYDTSARETLSGDMQPSLENLVNYSVVWAPTIKSMLLFGGNTFKTNTTKSDLYAYSPDNGWRLLDPTGTPPLARCDLCLVPAYSGTKMVLFGGMGNEPNQPNQFKPLGDLYILDVDTMTWTRGSDAGPAGARFGHSCAISGDYLIVWGGWGPGIMSNDTIVYNLKTATWTSEYVASPLQKTTTTLYVATPTSSGSQNSSRDGLATGTIVGTVGGVIAVLIAATIGLVMYSRRKRSKDSVIQDGKDTPPPVKPLPLHSSCHPAARPQLPLPQQLQHQTILPVTYHPQQSHHLHSEPTQVLSPESQPASIVSPPMSPNPNTIYVTPEEQAAISAQIVQADLIQQGYLKQYQAHVAAQAGRD
jgi:hypothetical protein